MYVKTIVAYCLFAVTINYAMERDGKQSKIKKIIKDLRAGKPLVIDNFYEIKEEPRPKYSKPQYRGTAKKNYIEKTDAHYENYPLFLIINRSSLSLEEKLKTIQKLIKKDKNITTLNPLDLAAITPNQEEKIITLRSNGENPYLPNADGKCSIFCAISTGNVENLEALLKEIPNNSKVIPNNIDWQDETGETFLHHVFTFAAQNKEEITTRMVQILIFYNANPNIPIFTCKLSCLHYAATEPYSAQSIRLLIQAGANSYIPDATIIPIELARMNRQSENIHALLQ